jgi:hypothetical protein
MPGELGSLTENVEVEFIYIAGVTSLQFISQLRYMQHNKGRTKLEVYLLMMLRYLLVSNTAYELENHNILAPKVYQIMSATMWKQLHRKAVEDIEAQM